MVSPANELRRKSVHLIGLIVPLLYHVAGKFATLVFVAVWTILFIIGEIYRLKQGMPRWVEKRAAPMMRGRERKGVGGHVYFSLGLFTAVLFYDKEIVTAVALITVLADGAAAIVGAHVGKHRLLGKKTLEGTLTLIAVAFMVSVWVVGGALAFTGGVVAGVVELLPINDNFSIPFFSGLAMTAMRYFL